MFRDFLNVRHHEGLDPIICRKRDFDDTDDDDVEKQQYSTALDSSRTGKTNETTNSITQKMGKINLVHTKLFTTNQV